MNLETSPGTSVLRKGAEQSEPAERTRVLMPQTREEQHGGRDEVNEIITQETSVSSFHLVGPGIKLRSSSLAVPFPHQPLVLAFMLW